MKIFFATVVWTATMALNLQAQAPTTVITQENADSVRLQWNSEPGKSYQVLGTPDIDPFSIWQPIGNPVIASGNTASLLANSTDARSFFKLHVLGQPGTGKPTASIISPSNGDTVGGLFKVVVGAQDDSRLTSVSLLIDGEEYEPQSLKEIFSGL